VAPDVKFCGLTRPEDAALAAALGAAYLGVIFAGGPRLLEPARARTVLDAAGAGERRPARVGVFGAASAEAIARVAEEAGLDVVQLHADPSPADVAAVRARFAGEVWAVIRTATPELPAGARALFDSADAVVLDARVAGTLGGSGVALDWPALAPAVEAARSGGRLVVAGGLHAENVARAVAALSPAAVDVSSGVERAPGIKDPARMRAFAAAAGLAGEHDVYRNSAR
jgi:phosphoribosylanthranilate isomerase